MGKPSPPAPPNPTATVQAQEQANSQSALQTAELNRINQYSPYGSSTYSTNGTYADGTPIYSQTTSLSPQLQKLYSTGLQGAQSLANTGVGMLGQIANTYSTPLSTAGTPGVDFGVSNPAGTPGIQGSVNTSGVPALQDQIGNGDYASQIQQAQNAAYGAQAQYLDPRFGFQQQELNNQLANQGIAQGSDAWNKAQTEFGLNQNQAYQSAQDAAVAAGNQEQNTLFGQAATQGAFQNAANQQAYGQAATNAQLANAANQQGYGQGLSSANLQNAAQAQAMQQLFGLRSEPLNEYTALTAGTQVQNPTFQSFPTAAVGNTNVGDIVNQGYQNQLAYYNAQQAASPWNALFGLGGSLISAFA